MYRYCDVQYYGTLKDKGVYLCGVCQVVAGNVSLRRVANKLDVYIIFATASCLTLSQNNPSQNKLSLT